MCPIRLVCGQAKYHSWVDWTRAACFVGELHWNGGLNIDDFHFDDPSSEEEIASESEPTEVEEDVDQEE